MILVLKDFYSCSFDKYSLGTYWMLGRVLEATDKTVNKITANNKTKRH